MKKMGTVRIFQRIKCMLWQHTIHATKIVLGRFFVVLEYGTHVGNNNSSAYPSYLRSDCVEYEGGRLVLKCKKKGYLRVVVEEAEPVVVKISTVGQMPQR